MVLNIKGNGLTGRRMEKGSLFMLMEIYMMGNGKMIKPMDMESIHIVTEQNMKGSGKMTHRMVKVQKHGLMVVSIVESIEMVRNMG
jgi:hypothetical protein